MPGALDLLSDRPEKRTPFLTSKSISAETSVKFSTTASLEIPINTKDGFNYSTFSEADIFILPFSENLILTFAERDSQIRVLEGINYLETPDVIISFYAVAFSSSLDQLPEKIEHKVPALIGHRGAGSNRLHGSTYPDYRENTLSSFKAAFNFGAKFIETDLSILKDGEFAIQHDQKVNGNPIFEMTSEEFLAESFEKPVKIDDSRILLKTLLNQNDERIGLNLELKFNEESSFNRDFVIEKLVQDVKKFGEKREIIYSTFDIFSAILLKIKQNDHPVYFLSDAGVWPRNFKDECVPVRNPIGNVADLTIEFVKKFFLDGIVLNKKCLEQCRNYDNCGLNLMVYGVDVDDLEDFKFKYPFVRGIIADLCQ